MRQSERPTKPKNQMEINPNPDKPTSNAPFDAQVPGRADSTTSVQPNAEITAPPESQTTALAALLKAEGNIVVLTEDLALLKRQHAKIEEQNRLMLATLRWYTDAYETQAVSVDSGKRAKQAFDWVTADNKKKA